MNLRLLLLLALACAQILQAETDWPHVRLETVPGTTSITFKSPIQVTHAGDGTGSLYVVEKAGEIVRIPRPPLYQDKPNFLDIRSKVRNGAEQGLLGLAFPPDFKTSRKFYVSYSRYSDGALVISRFGLNSQGLGAVDSEEILLVIPRPSSMHNGGHITFGPDGFFYIGVGDGGTFPSVQTPSQDPTSLNGKILRIDPRSAEPYAIPPGNPYAGSSVNRPEIWASGFRNPWRYSFDRLTGDLYLPDVGEYSWEELNILAAGTGNGGNFGWPYYEGNAAFVQPAPPSLTNLIFPALALPRSVAQAITGGYVYRGPESEGAPDPRLPGKYLFGDWGSRGIFAAAKDGEQWTYRKILTAPAAPTSFGESENGALYVTAGMQVYRIVPTGEVHPPEISLASGRYLADATARVQCATTGAKIHYTKESRDPTEADPYFTPGDVMTVNGTAEWKFKAFREGLLPSATVTRSYVLEASAPSVSPQGWAYHSDQNVVLTTTTADAKIHYSVDGSEPTVSHPFVTSGSSILVDRNMTVNARTFKGEYTPSPVITNTYTFKVASTWLSPSSSTVRPGTVITFSPSQTPDATLHYTTDGSDPTAASPVLSGPLTIERTMEIRVVAINGRYEDSYVTFHRYGVIHHLPGYLKVSHAGQRDTWGLADGARAQARFDRIGEICPGPAGSIYVADQRNNRIRQIDSAGLVTTFAGTGERGEANGPRASASFDAPFGICMDPSGALFVGEPGRLRRIDTNGEVTTVASLPETDRYRMASALDGTLYIAYKRSYFENSGIILRYLPGASEVTVFSESFDLAPYPDLAVDSEGNVLATGKEGFLKVLADGSVISLTGEVATWDGLGDGPLERATFGTTTSLAFGEGERLYFLDGESLRCLADGAVKTLIGSLDVGPEEGFGTRVRLWGSDLCVASDGRIYAVSENQIFLIGSDEDTDGDRIPDLVEVIRPPLSPGQNDGQIDSDDDGITNADELIQGSDAANPASRPEVKVHLEGGLPRYVTWPGSAFASHKFLYSTDLTNWLPLPSSFYSGLAYRADIPEALRLSDQLFFRVESTAGNE